MDKNYTIQGFFATIGAAIGFLLGGFDTFLIILFILCCCDFVSGILRMLINQEEFKTSTALKGLCKKIFYFVAIIAVKQISTLLNMPNLRDAIVNAFCFIEFLSVGKNIEKGLEIPIYSFFVNLAGNIKDPIVQLFLKKKEETK